MLRGFDKPLGDCLPHIIDEQAPRCWPKAILQPFGSTSLQIENRSTKNPKKSMLVHPLGDIILFVYGDAEQWFYKITDFTNFTDYQLVQRRPVVIASPTTGTETTDALPFLYPTQNSRNAQTYFFWHHPFLWVPWVLCALVRTSIRVIRAECGEETHSVSPSTHSYPFNLGYPWSANPFSLFQ